MVKQALTVKQYSRDEIVKQAQRSIGDAFSDVPFINLRETKTNVRVENKQVDFVFNALVSGRPAKFFIEVKSQGEPRLMRMAVAELKEYLKRFKDSYGILVAPYLITGHTKLTVWQALLYPVAYASDYFFGTSIVKYVHSFRFRLFG
jgi:hypothetical protein